METADDGVAVYLDPAPVTCVAFSAVEAFDVTNRAAVHSRVMEYDPPAAQPARESARKGRRKVPSVRLSIFVFSTSFYTRDMCFAEVCIFAGFLRRGSLC